jgi:tetratricopeptide (TPR) repeat protein
VCTASLVVATEAAGGPAAPVSSLPHPALGPLRDATRRLAESGAASAADLARRGDRPGAVAAAWRSLAQADTAAGRCALARALLQLGEPSAALEHAQRATELDPTLAEARFAMGAALEGLGRTEGARQAFRAALALRPEGDLADEARRHLGTGSEPGLRAAAHPPGGSRP